jgi:hypothetical protein
MSRSPDDRGKLKIVNIKLDDDIESCQIKYIEHILQGLIDKGAESYQFQFDSNSSIHTCGMVYILDVLPNCCYLRRTIESDFEMGKRSISYEESERKNSYLIYSATDTETELIKTSSGELIRIGKLIQDVTAQDILSALFTFSFAEDIMKS